MQSDTLVCFEGYHIVKETSCQALSMAFAVRATPVIVGSPAQIQKAPHPSCLALSLRDDEVGTFVRELENEGAFVVSLNL
jgi:hypothetical protein